MNLLERSLEKYILVYACESFMRWRKSQRWEFAYSQQSSQMKIGLCCSTVQRRTERSDRIVRLNKTRKHQPIHFFISASTLSFQISLTECTIEKTKQKNNCLWDWKDVLDVMTLEYYWNQSPSHKGDKNGIKALFSRIFWVCIDFLEHPSIRMFKSSHVSALQPRQMCALRAGKHTCRSPRR